MAAAGKIASRYAGFGRINRPSNVRRVPKLLSHYRFANKIETDGEIQIFETPLDRSSVSEASTFQLFFEWAKQGVNPDSLKDGTFADYEHKYREFQEDFPIEAQHTLEEFLRAEAIRKGRTGADYIATTIRNRSGDSLTVKFLVLDLDADRADERFKTDGVIDWIKAGAFLIENEPRFIDRLTRVVRSPSGKGLHLVIEFSPFQLGLKSMGTTEFLAKTVYLRLNLIFDWRGLGADPSAKGLDRWAANWENKDNLLDEDGWRDTRKRSESRRDRVLTDLFEYSRRHPALRPSKEYLYEKGKVLYPDGRTELKLANLYDHLSKDNDGSGMSLTFSKILEISGLAENTLRKVIKKGLPWLHVERHGSRYDLQLLPTIKLTRRCSWLLQAGDFKFELHEPEYVLDGERFNWVGSLAAHCKQHGVPQERLERALVHIIPRVPDWESSRNLTSNLPALIRAIYRNQEDLDSNRIGQQMVPWVENALEQAEISPTPINPFCHLKTLCKKGGGIPEGNKPLLNSVPDLMLESINTTDSSADGESEPTPKTFMPGSLRAGQALSLVAETASPGEFRTGGGSMPSNFQPVVDTGVCEFYPPGRADLLSKVLDPENIARARTDVVSRRSKAAGVDRITPEQLPGVWRNRGTAIVEQLRTGCYQPVPIRSRDIFKTSGGSRRISILSVVDRMLLKALDQILKPMIDPQFSRFSFGWRGGCSPRKAVAAANQHIADGFEWVGETDVKDCFGAIDHAMLLELVAAVTKDRRVVELVSRFIGTWSSNGVGIVQGSALSPLLANLFLNQLDKYLESEGIRFCRYGDDIRIFARTRPDAEAILRLVGERLGRMRLQMNPDKTGVGHASVVRFCQKLLEAPRPEPGADPAFKRLSCVIASDASRQPQAQAVDKAVVEGARVIPRTVRNPAELSDDEIGGEFSYQLMGDNLPGDLKMMLLNSLGSMSREQGLSAQRQYLTVVYSKSIGIDTASLSSEKFQDVTEGQKADSGPVHNVERPDSDAFAHLSGSALRGAFSKTLLKSQLPAAEKTRILTEVTSIEDPNLKDRLRREWLARLQ